MPPMDRQELANVVILCDGIIVIFLIFNMAYMFRAIDQERRVANDKALEMNDFSVRIKNLPPSEEYRSLDELKAQLTMHIKKILQNETE